MSVPDPVETRLRELSDSMGTGIKRVQRVSWWSGVAAGIVLGLWFGFFIFGQPT